MEYIIASEFDINLGPVIRYLYPRIIPGDLPYFTELLMPDQIDSRDQDWAVIILHKDHLGNYHYVHDSDVPDSPLYIINVVNTRYDAYVDRNTIIKGMAIATTLPCLQIFKPLLLFALDKSFGAPAKDIVVELYRLINHICIQSIPQMPDKKRLLLACINDFPVREYFNNKVFASKTLESQDASAVKNGCYEVMVNYLNLMIPLRVPLLQLPDIVGDFLVTKFLTQILSATVTLNGKYPELEIYGQATPSLVILLNAFLTHKRIFFLGNRMPAQDICEFVFAAISLVSGGGGIVSGFFKRTLPYVDLSKFDIIEQLDWFIAGTANPSFKIHDELWDVLYDIEENELIFSSNGSPHLPQLSPTLPKSSTGEVSSPSSGGFGGFLFPGSPRRNSNVQDPYSVPFIQEDSNFLKQLETILSQKHDDETILGAFRHHMNEILRIINTEVDQHKHLTASLRYSKDSKHSHVESFTSTNTSISVRSSMTSHDSILGILPVKSKGLRVNTVLASTVPSSPSFDTLLGNPQRPTRLETALDLKTYYLVHKDYCFKQDINPLVSHFQLKMDLELLHHLSLLHHSAAPLTNIKTYEIYNYLVRYVNSNDSAVYDLLISCYLVGSTFDQASLTWTNNSIETICMGLYHKEGKVKQAACEILLKIRLIYLGKLILKQSMNAFFRLALDEYIDAPARSNNYAVHV